MSHHSESWLHCQACNSQRKGPDTCWKCGGELSVPCDGWEYPRLPDVDLIRKLAKEVGYAIGEHGSKERDLDVIAVPWTDAAVGNYDLLLHLCKGLNAKIVSTEEKPLGRWAANLNVEGWYKLIDISIAPRIKSN